MMSLRSRDDAATNAVMIVAMVALAALLIVLIAVPKPRPMSSTILPPAFYDAQAKASDAQKQEDLLKSQVATRTWTILEQQVGWSALARITAATRASNLKLVSFRPQRKGQDGTLVKLPYTITVDGTYPQVLALLKALEQPQNKLAVTIVQIASADNSTDRVTGSMQVVAYMNPSQEEPAHSG